MQGSAVVAARSYARKKIQGDPDSEAAAEDPDLLDNAKAIELLARCCLRPEPDDPKSKVLYPVFTGSGWMRDHLSADDLAYLVNCLKAAARSFSPLRSDIDYGAVTKLARACWAARDTDVPEAVLADCDREYLTQVVVLLSCQLADALDWAKDGPEESDDTEDDND
jgi:hypothetical protein